MARRILQLLSQKQVDQAIKNFIVESNPKSTHVRLRLNGGTAISFEIYKDYVNAYRAKKNKWIFLGYYYSEDLETDPEINYQMPPEPFYTYDEILQRGEEVKRYGRVISDDAFGKIDVKDSKCVNEKKVDAAKLEEVKVDDEKKEKETLKESLKRRLRLLDLKIEREEILNQLAAI